MDPNVRKLVKELQNAGLSDQAIGAAWPSWWTDEAGATPSGRAELRFALARKLGLSPRSLLGERVEFVWKDDARFKNLTASDAEEHSALASFGVAIGRLMLRATPPGPPNAAMDPVSLRRQILAARPFVDLLGLLSACWALGIPVIYLRVFPLKTKSMRAMVVEMDGRHCVLLGRDSKYPAPVSFTLAHEMGHAALGHIRGTRALVDLGDSFESAADPEERQADAYGMALLTGSPDPKISTSNDTFGARSLAKAVLDVGPTVGIEPGTLALCVGYMRRDWPTAIAAQRYIYDEQKDVWREVNQVAMRQFHWEALSGESADYLRNVMTDQNA